MDIGQVKSKVKWKSTIALCVGIEIVILWLAYAYHYQWPTVVLLCFGGGWLALHFAAPDMGWNFDTSKTVGLFAYCFALILSMGALLAPIWVIASYTGKQPSTVSSQRKNVSRPDPVSWEDARLAGIRLEKTPRDVITVLGRPDTPSIWRLDLTFFDEPNDWISCRPARGGWAENCAHRYDPWHYSNLGVIVEWTADGKVNRVHVDPLWLGRTPRGLRVGDNLALILDKYGPPDLTGDTGEFGYQGNGWALFFHTDSNANMDYAYVTKYGTPT